MERLDGLDDRALVLEDGGWLNCLRWGATQNRFHAGDLGETEIKADGKDKIRLRFGGIATAIWVPLEQEQAARDFAAAVDAARP